MSSSSVSSSMRSLRSFSSSSSSSSSSSKSSTSSSSSTSSKSSTYPPSPSSKSSAYPPSSKSSSKSTTYPPSSSVFTTSFTQSASSRLTFCSFPPTNVPKNSLDGTSLQVAIALLQNHRTYISTLNPLGTECPEILQSSSETSNLDPIKLLAEFRNPASAEAVSDTMSARSLSTKSPATGDWKYYTVFDTLPLPMRIVKSKTTYHVALRVTLDGIESFVLADNCFILHHTVRIESRESSTDKERAGESLWLVETAELRCWRGLAWYIEMNMAENRELKHDRFRVRWDREVLEALEQMRTVNAGCAM